MWDFCSLGGYGPVLATERVQSRMRINEQIRKGVFFIGILDAKGEFVPYGTAFIVALKIEGSEQRFAYMVSAKHVIDDMKKTNRPLVGRLNVKSGPPQIGRLRDDGWVIHPTITNCDIVVSHFSASTDTFDFDVEDTNKRILGEEYIKANNVGCGDEVHTIGLLVNHFGKERNTTIVRTGNIAAMPEEAVYLNQKLGRQKVYLVESRSIGGLSGSPVYLATPPYRIIGNLIAHMVGHESEYLLGVNIGLFETKAHGDAIPTDERRAEFLETMSAGIAIVVPIQRVIEIITEAPELITVREDSLKQSDIRSGFSPSSGAPAVHLKIQEEGVSSANPDHLEDFTSLLNAAAKTKPQAD
jgi:hypothetical protein